MAAAGVRLLVALVNALPFGGAGKQSCRAADRFGRDHHGGPRRALLDCCWPSAAARRATLLTAGLAGGLLGLLSAAPWFSVLQSAERLLGSWSTSIAAVCLLWALLARCSPLLRRSSSLTARTDRQVEPMMARYMASVLVVLCSCSARLAARARRRPTRRSRRRSRRVLNSSRTRRRIAASGTSRRSNQHPLGMTALAGLALLENGVAREAREISKAREIVTTLARESDQTYDLALAILFLARCQQTRTGDDDALIQTLGRRLAQGDHEGIWDYSVPRDVEEPTPRRAASRRGARRKTGRRNRAFSGGGDNSNTQFALLGLWAAGRHGFDSDADLESIDGHFRSTQLDDGRWGYRIDMQGTEAMSCAGLMGLAIAASRPSLAERQTARARGAALAADPAFQSALARRRPGRPPGRESVGHLLPLVARTGVRGARPALARRV